MNSKRNEKEDPLLKRYIACIQKQAMEMPVPPDSVPPEWPLATGLTDGIDYLYWRPIKVTTDFSELDEIYSKLPAKFPPLFEQLVLSCRWVEVDLGTYTLLPNPPGPDLSGLLRQMTRNKAIWDCLSSKGYIQFGKGPDMDYDPVCFDLSSRKKNQEYRVVKIDHEEILCYDRLKVVEELAPSFKQLVQDTVERVLGNAPV